MLRSRIRSGLFFFSSLTLTLTLTLYCTPDFTPKPKGYPRIALPEKEYQTYQSDCPFTFQYHKMAKITAAMQSDRPCWLNVDYPSLKCRIHLSYLAVDGNLAQMMEDTRTLVYKHTVKASAIDLSEFADTERKLYGGIFNISGNAASSVQFYATDSLKHFLRGALYFNAAANADSLQPAIDYVREDVKELVESLTWK